MKKMVFIATAGLGACLLQAAPWFPAQPSPDEAAIACINAYATSGSDVGISATFASNTAEVVIGSAVSDRHTFLRAVDLSGRTGTGTGASDGSAFQSAGADDVATGAAILLKRLSGGVYGAGVTNAFGLLAWSDSAYADNPATIRIDHLTGTVSANVHPDGTAAALYARTSLSLNLTPGALLFGGSYGWDHGDQTLTNAQAELVGLLVKVKAGTATAAESNTLESAASGYAVLGGEGEDLLRFGGPVTLFGQVDLGDGADVVSLCDLPSNTVVRLPAIANAELLLITNSPIFSVSNIGGPTETAIAGDSFCTLSDAACTLDSLSGTGTLATEGVLWITNLLSVSGALSAPTGSALKIMGNLGLADGLAYSLRACATAGGWTNDRVTVTGTVTVGGGCTVNLGCAPADPIPEKERRIIMTAAGGVINPAKLASWTLAGTGRDEDSSLIRRIATDGYVIYASVSKGGTLLMMR